ncbi:UNVERIFIED_CONTAM: hypothetical protein Sradi_4034800 [Sesamum radiatum]|uniref:Reverse transcriptase zinc-binding domain-containing protein n=1 Tax=Sesamum radiatum TaxID=300843 RepID=A0AAW2PI98_SESRA
MLNGETRGSDDQQSWRFIWTLKAQPKVFLFAWRAVRNALPMLVQLRRRGIQIDETCNGCLGDLEDVGHVLATCSFARQVWALFGLPWKIVERKDVGIEEWFRKVFQELRGHDFYLFKNLLGHMGIWQQVHF